MGALRKHVEVEHETTIFVLPYNQPRLEVLTGGKEQSSWSEFFDNEIVDQVVFVFKAFAVTAVLGFAFWALSSAYEQKNELGIDLVPGVSMSQYLIKL